MPAKKLDLNDAEERIISRLDERGHEVLNDDPVSIPVKFRRVETVIDSVRRLVAGEYSRLAQRAGYDTFEEEDDFDVDDDPELRSRYEIDDFALEDNPYEGYGAKPAERAPDGPKDPAEGKEDGVQQPGAGSPQTGTANKPG